MEHASVEFGGSLWAVSTDYRERKQQILLHRVSPGGETDVFKLTDLGRYDNPTVCRHNGLLYVCWENNQTERRGLSCVSASLSACIGETRSITQNVERAYSPLLISDTSTMYLIYESFFDRRYHVMVRCLPRGKGQFENPVEIGFETGNDMSPSACLHQGGILVAWENSYPLDRNYQWIDAAGGVVTMPSFGHGWRVSTSLGIRRVSLTGNTIAVENLGPSKEMNDKPEIMADESGGMPNVFSDDNGNIYIGYVSWRGRSWDILVSRFVQNRWEDLLLIDEGYDRRTQPALAIKPGQLVITDGNGMARAHRLPNEKSEFGFTTLKMVELAAIPHPSPAVAPPRESIRHGEKELKLFWGDLHMHTNISKCSLHPKFHCSEIEAKYRVSRDIGGLDFALVTDHETMTDREWERTVKAAHLNNRDHHFTAFVGFEWTSSQLKQGHNFGHYNILYKDEGPLLRISDPDFSTIQQVWDSFEDDEAISIPHHPGDETHPLDWEFYGGKHEPLIEIYQVRGSYESDDCEMAPESYGRQRRPGRSVQHGLNMGYRLGFTAGGEHEGVGITAVYAEELTREGIFDALQRRCVYGTTSEKILLDFRIEGQLMGSEVTTSHSSLVVDVHVKGCDTLDYVALVQSERETFLFRSDGNEQNEITLRNEISVPANSEWYYIRTKQQDGNMAWSSPIWVDREDGFFS